MRFRKLWILGVALLWAASAVAQEIQPVTYYADFNVRPGQEEQFMNLVKKYDEPVLQKLLEEGALLAWGVDVPMMHMPGGTTHSIWWSVPGLGSLDKAFAAFEEAEKKWKEEETAAAEQARRRRQSPPPSIEEQFLETVDISRHRDWLLRSQLSNFAEAAPPADAKPYSWITVLKVKPGKERAFRQLLDRYIKPTYDKLVADGTIIGYEFGTEEAKTTDEFTHYFWVVLPDMAAREKARAAFRVLGEERGPEANQAVGDNFLETYEPSATRNFWVRTILLRVAPPK